MAELIFAYAPNTTTCCDVDNTTDWHVVATDGTGYASLAALTAAGKAPLGTKDPGLFWLVVNMSADNGSEGASSGFFIAFNQITAPVAAPQGVEYVAPGMNKTEPTSFNNVWVKKSVGTDRFFFAAKW
jgi:hypothetical protein